MKKILLLLFIVLNFLYSKQNSIGFGIINSSKIYINEEDKRTFIPLINYSYEKFYIKALEIGYKQNKYFSIIAQPRLNEVKFDGIDTRKRTLEAGFKLTYPIDKYRLTFKTLFDTFGIHNGYHGSLKLSRTFVKIPFIFIPNIGLEYQDSNFNDYYYGVDNHEAFSNYKVEETLNKTAGFVSIFKLNKNSSINLIYNYKKLDSNISNSPIIIRDNKHTSILSFQHKF